MLCCSSVFNKQDQHCLVVTKCVLTVQPCSMWTPAQQCRPLHLSGTASPPALRQELAGLCSPGMCPERERGGCTVCCYEQPSLSDDTALQSNSHTTQQGKDNQSDKNLKGRAGCGTGAKLFWPILYTCIHSQSLNKLYIERKIANIANISTRVTQSGNVYLNVRSITPIS